ncbi:MAG TPA: 2-phospho-L-lactate guanylyltransferase [Actinomycetota bacterium]|nr:2-phospho-L-lactate guanylyltransferase [Actinomycetota bacterium]
MRVLVVPVKDLARAKSRLAPVLRPPERARLSLVMLEGVLRACLAQEGWGVWVISRDAAALEAAANLGARPVPEHGHRLLSAVRQAESEVTAASREPADPQGALAIVLADLPLISAGALAAALGHGPSAQVVAASAASDGGTNLLLRHPPSVIPARFGRSSLARHRTEAYRRGVTFREVRIAELGFDLDEPRDIASLLERPTSNPTRRTCIEMGLPGILRVLA